MNFQRLDQISQRFARGMWVLSGIAVLIEVALLVAVLGWVLMTGKLPSDWWVNSAHMTAMASFATAALCTATSCLVALVHDWFAL